MATSQFEREQDAKAAEIGIKIERRKIDVPTLNYKGQQRKQKEKAKLLKQRIKLTLFDANGDIPTGCQWRVPRAKLTSKFLQELISKSPLPGKLEVVQNMTTQKLVLPDDMQIQCMPEPYEFRVILREIRVAQDVSDDPHFVGYKQLIISSVPLLTDGGDNKVTEADVRAYLRCGIVEEHPEVIKARELVEKTKEKIEYVKKEVAKIPTMQPLDDRGKKMKAADADAERQRQYDKCMKEKAYFEKKLDSCKANMETQATIVKRIPFDLSLVTTNDREGTSIWHIRFHQGELDDRGEMVGFNGESALVKKKDWDGIRLCVGWTEKKQKTWAAVKKEAPAEERDEDEPDLPYVNEEDEIIFEDVVHPPWVGRGDPPDGSKQWLPDYTPYQVNMKGARIQRVQHGIGLHKQLNDGDVDFQGPDFNTYHGQWRLGKRHGFGQMYSDQGIYSGYWDGNRMRGHGQFDYPHGTSFKGNFGVVAFQKGKNEGEDDTYDLSPIASNPYQEGRPNGVDGMYTFADGSVYRGSVVDGRITGPGRYENAMGEVSEGEFRNGQLHGKGKFTDMIGNSWEGTWRDGQLFEEGTYVSRHKDRYNGTWRRHEKHGRGFERHRNGNQSMGFYSMNDRDGHGVMHHGHVRERYDPRLQRIVISHRKTFEGFWCGGRAAKKGCDTSFPFKQRYYTINTRNPDKHQFLKNVYDIILQQDKKTKMLKDKYYKLDLFVRREVTKKKMKMFGWQKHNAKLALRNDAIVEQADNWNLVDSLSRRQGLVDKLVEKKMLEQAEVDEAIDNVPITIGAEALEKIAAEEGQPMFKPALVKVIQSEFEAFEEQKRLNNYESLMKVAKKKLAKHEATLNGGMAPAESSD